MHECIQERRFELIEKQTDTINQTHLNVALVVHTLLGDEGKNNGLVDKVTQIEEKQASDIKLYGRIAAVILGIGIFIGAFANNLPAIAKIIKAVLL